MGESVRLGILCPAEIAYRRFLPALLKQPQRFSYIGIAAAGNGEWGGSTPPTPEMLQARKKKLDTFLTNYGGKVFPSYQAMLTSSEIDAVYIPLPPALHAYWGRQALLNGKHVLLEKPFTASREDTLELIQLSEERSLAIHENYMFIYHSQLKRIQDLLNAGSIGIPRVYRMSFGFPRRPASDFRYRRELGGGALLDCGGYPLRLALELLGDSAHVVHSRLMYQAEYEVDIAGSATVENAAGDVAQISFGMDNEYRCELDIWGSAGNLSAQRIFTAGPEIAPIITLRQQGKETQFTIPAYDQFEASILDFYESVINPEHRIENRFTMVRQAEMVHAIQESERKQ